MSSRQTFCVLTVTKRTGWEQIAEESMARQYIFPDLWVIVAEEPEKINITKFPANVVKIIKAPKKKRLSNLNASLNAGLKLIDSSYVIFYQDFIELQPDCFSKLLQSVNRHDTFVTTCTPNYDGSDDSRYTGVDKIRTCRPEEWEANVAIAPMAIIKQLGGFDEEYDNGWSWDNVNLAQRAAMLGAKFKVDESNRPKLHLHELTSKLEMPLNYKRHMDTMEDIKNYKKSIKLEYL